jgi:hypothetical protein
MSRACGIERANRSSSVTTGVSPSRQSADRTFDRCLPGLARPAVRILDDLGMREYSSTQAR